MRTGAEYSTAEIFGLLGVGKLTIAGKPPRRDREGIGFRNCATIIKLLIQYWSLTQPIGIGCPINEKVLWIPLVNLVQHRHFIALMLIIDQVCCPHTHFHGGDCGGLLCCVICWYPHVRFQRDGAAGHNLVTVNDLYGFTHPDGDSGVGFTKLHLGVREGLGPEAIYGLLNGGPGKFFYHAGAQSGL